MNMADASFKLFEKNLALHYYNAYQQKLEDISTKNVKNIDKKDMFGNERTTLMKLKENENKLQSQDGIWPAIINALCEDMDSVGNPVSRQA
ncbi:hypothetical protein [Planococcus sp. ISL-110]|uniref:hypothetical protein n=1 Tax=Planococcus sp. ISL-110 TaxID=2819167 RepID=UPI001BE81A59|nr:hypothetical protein [Planococcus sp. ISL-110]MBT2572180.1 hypothetical protein [Planococcus sp. ISL-110]